MSEGARYHLKRGRMPRLVDQVGPRPRAYGTADQVPRLAAGSVADLTAITAANGFVADELGELAVPVVERMTTTFGALEVVVERYHDRVALVLPGMVRLVGSADDAAALAATLARKSR